MDNNKLNTIKNLFWLIAIFLCTGAVVFAIVFAMFQRYYGQKESFGINILSAEAESPEKTEADDAIVGSGLGNQRGELKILQKTEDAGEEYLEHVYFLVDSTFLNMRQSSCGSRTWASESGSLPLSKVNESGIIKFPNDGSMISAAEAAMIIKPEILVIGLGSDALADTTEDEFIKNYDTLINDILSASPETQIICCGLPGVVETYNNVDRLDVTVMSDGNDWVQLVCRDTGACFLNVREAVTESAVLLTRFADSNGKTLNSSGISEFLMYLRTHGVQLKTY